MNRFGLGRKREEQLFTVIRNNDICQIDELLSQNPVMFNTVDSVGENALRIAAECGNLQILYRLLVASVNSRGTHVPGGPALCKAVELGNLEIVRYLFTCGVSVHATDVEGNTPIIWAAYSGNLEMLMALVSAEAEIYQKAPNGLPPLVAAAFRGHKDFVEYLISSGVDVNMTNNLGVTALHWAAEKGYEQIAEILIKAGAQIDTRNNNQYTPLLVAALCGQKPLVFMLVKAGAEVNARNPEGQNALQLYWDKDRDKEILSLMIEAGIYPDTHLGYGSNLLHWVAEYGDVESAKRLIEAGADVNANPGCTPLFEAVEHNHSRIVTMLIEAGADVNSGDIRGSNPCVPLLCAIIEGRLNLVEKLVAAGARLDITTERGYKPIDIARNYRRQKIIEFLEEHETKLDAMVVRGGFKEPYCSQKCLDDAGSYAFSAMVQKQEGVCGFCQKPVRATMYDTKEGFVDCVVMPYEGVTLFICTSCVVEGSTYLKSYKKCCMCQKDLML